MSLVPGEDTESDEEIDTDQVHDASGRADKSKKVVPRAGLVTGEDSEEEDDDDLEGADSSKKEAVDGSLDSIDQLQQTQATKTPKPVWQPPSLLHKKLGESNASLRKNIVDCILKLYHQTCRNLTDVNDNLSRTQAVIEKVNASVKKSDQDLDQVNSSIDDIRDASLSFAPSLRMDIPIKTLPSKQAASKEKTPKKQPAAKTEKTSSVES